MELFHFYDFIVVIVFILLVVLSLNEIVLGQLERDLGNHMILEHTLFFSIGSLSVCVAERILKFMVSNERNSFISSKSKIQRPPSRATGKAIQYWKATLRTIFKLNTHPWSWIAIAGSLIFVWHIPQIFDYASTHDYVHVIQHLSFIMVGAATFMIIRLLGESFNLFLIFSLIGMMGFSGLILVISDNPIYQVYSIRSHHNAGIYMIISFVILLLVIMPTYLIRRTMFHINTSTSGGDE
jgi:caa3-type cytochrome oxidase assembly factor Caa3/CtaG